MPSATVPVNLRQRALRVLAVAIAAMAVTFAFAAVTPQQAYAYTSYKADKSVGKVTGKRYGRTFYGNSVEDVMAIVDDMVSTHSNKLHEDEVTIDLLTDWNTKSYGRIKVPNGYTFHINLHGHMINRGKALSYGDNKWYAEGSGEVIFVDGGTLYLNGGSSKENYQHTGSYVGDEYFWQYTGAGITPCMYGGLITGGACDDWHGAGGISLARDTSRAFITNTTIAGNITDQYDGRYGHGAGIAVHGSKCTLELDNVRIASNHAEGYGGGVYVRNTDCALSFKNCTFEHNYSAKGGGAVYLDSKATLNIENGSFASNTSDEDGAAIYVNAKGSTLNIKGTGENYVKFTENKTKKSGAVIYTDSTDTTVNVERAYMLRNTAGADYGSSTTRDGGVFYIGDNSSTLNITDCVMEYNSTAHGRGGVVYFYGNDSGLNITGSTFNNNTAKAANSGGAGQARGGVIYHAGRRGKVTIKNSKMKDNEADNHGGVVYSEYSGTEFEATGSTFEGNKASTDGAAFYFADTSTLTLDNSTIKGNTASACGGGVYVSKNAGSSKVYLKNNSSICNNTAATNCSGGAIYAENTITVSSDGTGTITGNKAAKDGGGIWVSGSLYLDNVSITDNTAGNAGGGVYCDNTENKTFELANKVTIWGNRGSNNSDSNLHLRKGQTVCSADGDRKLSTESKIGVAAEDASATSVRRVSGNQLMMQALGDKYSTVFYSDNADYAITASDGYVNLDPDTSGKIMVTVKIGSYKKSVAPTGDSSTVELSTSEILNFDETSYNAESFLNRSTYSTIDYYTVTDAVGERRIEVKDGKATVELRGSQATAVPHVVRTVGSFGIQVEDAASWSELPDAGSSKVSVKFLNFRERLWTLYYEHHNDWIKDHSATHEVECSDGAGYDHWTETEYDWWDNDPTAGTELIPKVSTYNYSFDNILRGADAAAAATVTRTKVEDTSGGRQVTYQVTIKKDTLYAKDLKATSSDAYGLLEFEGNAIGTDENGLGSQTVSDQDADRTNPTYKTQKCTTSVDSEGNQVVTFTVTYPKTRAVVTFDAGEGTLPDGTASKVTVNASKTLPSMPKATREGYVFDGWYTGDTKVTSTTEFTSDTTVVAHWTERSAVDTAKYRMVLYMSQEGSDSSDLSIVDIDLARFLDDATETAINEPAQPSREGYTFGGWYKDAACSDDQKFNFSTDTVAYSETDEDFQLYAKWTANTYTVTLKDADDNVEYEYDVSYGSYRTYEDLLKNGIVRNPTREDWTGLEFAGWTLNGQLYDFTTPVTGNITLTPSWKTKTHTVTYETSDDEGADEASGQAALVSLMTLADDGGTAAQDSSSDTGTTKVQVADKDTAPEFEPTRKGYRFDGWYIDKGRTEVYDFTKTVTGDFTLYAKWVKTATIAFDTGEGAESVASLTVDVGSTVKSSELPLAVRENYRFHGWLTGSAEDGTAVASEFTVDDDTTLYAHWVGNTVFVYLHGIYGDNEISYDMKNYGDVLEGIQVNTDHADPVRAGYTFGGWFTDEDCTEEYKFGKDALTGDLDLYAKWVPESCTVKFVDSLDGSELGGEVVSGGEVAGEPEASMRSGYVLKGWFMDAACSQAWDFSEPVTSDMTLYVGWAEAVTVTLDTNGGELPDGVTSLAVEKGAPVGNLPVPRRGVTGEGTASADDGYVFAGWYTKDGQKVNADTKFAEDTVLTAYWVRNGEVCFVTYYSAGEMLDYDIVKTGDKLARPADPTRAGYEFTGWYIDEACTKAYDFDAAVTSDMNLYAGWKTAAGGSDTDTDGGGSGKKDGLPRTGDDSLLAIGAVLAVGCVLVLVGVIVKRRQR